MSEDFGTDIPAPAPLTKEQEAAVACAYSSLVGVHQAYEQGLSIADIDMDAVSDNIDELESNFPFLLIDDADAEVVDGVESVGG